MGKIIAGTSLRLERSGRYLKGFFSERTSLIHPDFLPREREW